MESRSIYNINSRQHKQLVQASNSLPANVNSYFNSVVYGANKVVLSRVRNNGGKYSTSGEDNKNNPSNCSSGNISPSKNNLDLLGDTENNPSENSLDLLGDMENNPSNDLSNDSSGNISPSKIRRKKGEGSGYVYWRLVNKNRKVYWQAYYPERSLE